MADPNRVTKAFGYAIEAGTTDRRVTKAFGYAIRSEPVGVGAAPVLRVGGITQTTADLSVDPLAEYLSVTYETYLDTSIVDAAILTGPTRFVRPLSGLAHSTTYHSRARVERTAGTSPWSEWVEWTTAAPGVEALRSCPPVPIGHLQNPDGNPPNFPGRGWYVPFPGQPLRETVTCALRHPDPAWLWDIHLSDDRGQSYTEIVTALESDGLDGDGLYLYRFELDTTLLSDGVDYRLHAISAIPGDDEEYESLTFCIDNAEEVYGWRHSDGPIGERFGRLWAEAGASSVFGVPENTIWVHGVDGGVGAIANHDWAFLADRLIPQSKGGDVTLCYYLWTGEGGLFSLQGRDDLEQLHVGSGFFGTGLTTSTKSGLFAGLFNGTTWPLGCCDDVYTSSTARALAGIPSGGTNIEILPVEGGGTSDELAEIRKMYAKAVQFPFFSPVPKSSFFKAFWRHGPGPGDIPTSDRTCGRRYEMYAQRVRVEEDPADDTRIRVRFRLDGPGVVPPASGYWHFDEWCTLDSPLGCGALGFVSRQFTTSTWGTINGVRVFMSWAAKPLDVCGPVPEVEPEELPEFIPPVEGEPCTLILQVFEDDRETLAWEVGTDTGHPNPYLALPEHYGEQEIDIVHGAASIGQVEVVVVDKSQTEGDQDSGWLTERLSEGGVTAIHGARCRLIRFISRELGWVVIADGPAANPKMDESYAAYRWTIRDTRETERKVRAFVRGDTSWLVPMGVEDGWGAYVDEDGLDQWLVPPQDPLTGEYEAFTHTEGISFESYWPTPWGTGPFAGPDPNDVVPEDIRVIEAVEDALIADAEELGDPLPVQWTWPELEILWREAGSEDEWTVVQPTDLLEEGRSLAKPAGAGRWWRRLASVFDAKDAAGNTVRALGAMMIKGVGATGDFPTLGQQIDVAVRRSGPPTPFAPKHIEYNEDGTRKTVGELLVELYEGVYSPPDPITGEDVPTAIRYDREAVLQMDDPVLLRLTERVEDLRAWTEEKLYAPTGWVPALDNDGRISPVSQVPPDGLCASTTGSGGETDDGGGGGGGSGGSGEGGENEPAGYTAEGEHDFSTKEGGGWTLPGAGTNLTIQTDATAPISPDSVGRCLFAEGEPGGAGSLIPLSLAKSDWASGEFYFRFALKVSANWQGHSSSINKVIYVTGSGAGGSGDPLILIIRGSDANTLRFEIRHQNPGLSPSQRIYAYNSAENEISPSADDAEVVRDTWAIIEVVVAANTPGSTDGEIHAWVGGVKVLQFTDAEPFAAGDTPTFDNIRWEPVWGGSGDEVEEDMYQYMDDFYLSTP